MRTRKSGPTPEMSPYLRLCWQLAARLERLSVDSHWAVQASGVRRSLIRLLDQVGPDGPDEEQQRRLEALLQRGFEIIENGARDMGDRQ